MTLLVVEKNLDPIRMAEFDFEQALTVAHQREFSLASPEGGGRECGLVGFRGSGGGVGGASGAGPCRVADFSGTAVLGQEGEGGCRGVRGLRQFAL